MYERVPEGRAISLRYGYKLRYIGAILGLTRSGFGNELIEVFTPEETETIRTVCKQARERAERIHREERQRHAEANLGPEAEPRQYTGK